MNPYWSWGLTAIGLVGIWLQGDKKKLGWLIGIVAQGIWITYGVMTEQHGFILSAVVYGFFYGRNYWRWKHETA